jgi:ankyrin repeat protein
MNQAKLSLTDKQGCAPVHFASQVSSECLKILIDAGIDRNCQNDLGLTPSMWACHADKVDNLTLLLAEHEDAGDVKDNKGRGLIHWAAVCQGCDMHCLKLLLDETSVRLQDSQGRTALHFAALKGHELSCQLIGSSHPESLNLLDSDGCTALHLAAMYGHANIVNCLLQLGADPAIKDGQGETALDYTERLGLQYCHWLLTSLSHCLQSQQVLNLHGHQHGGSEINTVLSARQSAESPIIIKPEPQPPSPVTRPPQSPRFRSHVQSGNSRRSNLDESRASSHSTRIHSSQNEDAAVRKNQLRLSSSVDGEDVIITAAHSSGSDTAQNENCSPQKAPAQNIMSHAKLIQQTFQNDEFGVSNGLQCHQTHRNVMSKPLEAGVRNLQVVRRGKNEAAPESIMPLQKTPDMMKYHSQQLHPGIDGLLQVSCGPGVGLSSPSKVCLYTLVYLSMSFFCQFACVCVSVCVCSISWFVCLPLCVCTSVFLLFCLSFPSKFLIARHFVPLFSSCLCLVRIWSG